MTPEELHAVIAYQQEMLGALSRTFIDLHKLLLWKDLVSEEDLVGIRNNEDADLRWALFRGAMELEVEDPQGRFGAPLPTDPAPDDESPSA